MVALSIWRVGLAPRVHSGEPGKQAGSLPPWPATPEDESLNFELGVDAQCQEMPLADRADFEVTGRTTLRWQALVGECGTQPATYRLYITNYNRLKTD